VSKNKLRINNNRSLFIGLVILFIIIAAIAAWGLSNIRNKKILDERIAVEKESLRQTQNILRELGLLEGYYVENSIPFPEDYQGNQEGVREIVKLQPGVIEREVAWRSGGFIFVFSPEGKEDTADLAKQKIEEYHTRALGGEGIADLIEESKSDPDFIIINQPLTTTSSVGVPPNYLISSLFNMYSQNNNPLLSSREANQAIFSLGKGDVSQVYSDNSGYTFFVVIETGEGKFDTYDSWLSEVSSGKLDSSIDTSGLIINGQ